MSIIQKGMFRSKLYGTDSLPLSTLGPKWMFHISKWWSGMLNTQSGDRKARRILVSFARNPVIDLDSSGNRLVSSCMTRPWLGFLRLRYHKPYFPEVSNWDFRLLHVLLSSAALGHVFNLKKEFCDGFDNLTTSLTRHDGVSTTWATQLLPT